MNAIVHIGYHKTGTNWFQRHLYPNVISHTYIRRPVVREALLDIGAFTFNAQTAHATMGLDQNPNPILCEEELSGNIHTGGLDGCLSKDMAHRIHSVLPSATIVIFIRNQVSMVASAYKQYVREGGTYGVDQYLNTPNYWHNSGFRQAKAPHFTFDHFDYLPLIQHYAQIFGRNQVKVYPFELFVKQTDDFVDTFADDLNLTVEWNHVEYKAENEPYRAITHRLAKVANRFTYRDVAYKRYWLNIPGLYRKQGKLLRAFNRTRLAGKNLPPTAILSQQHMRAVHDRYSKSNQRLADEFGLPLAELGYPTQGPLQ